MGVQKTKIKERKSDWLILLMTQVTDRRTDSVCQFCLHAHNLCHLLTQRKRPQFRVSRRSVISIHFFIVTELVIRNLLLKVLHVLSSIHAVNDNDNCMQGIMYVLSESAETRIWAYYIVD